MFWGGIFQERWGDINAVALVKPPGIVFTILVTPVGRQMDSAGAGAVNGYRD